MPDTVRHCEEFRLKLESMGLKAEWIFVSDYIKKYGIKGLKKPGPCTNKNEDSENSPSFSRWVSKPIDIITHKITLEAMEAYRSLGIISCLNQCKVKALYPGEYMRSWITHDIETLNDYPWVEKKYFTVKRKIHLSDRIKHLLAWGANSDARGWYPMWERTVERREALQEARMIADSAIRKFMRPGKKHAKQKYFPVIHSINLFPKTGRIIRISENEPVDIIDSKGYNLVSAVIPCAGKYEHILYIDSLPYSRETLVKKSALNPNFSVCAENKKEVKKGSMSLSHVNDKIIINNSTEKMCFSIEPFKILVKRLDKSLRPCAPEGESKISVRSGKYPILCFEKQLDYHVHYKGKFITDGKAVFARFKFYFSAPTLVDAKIPENTSKPDFAPGGIIALLETGTKGDIIYDVPFGETLHKNKDRCFIAALTHTICAGSDKGCLLSSAGGVQSFRVWGAKGELGMCLGRSETSGGRRKMNYSIGNDVYGVKADEDWYNEIFYGEYSQDFVIMPFTGSWQKKNIPTQGRAFALGPRLVESIYDPQCPAETLYCLKPDNVMIAGAFPQDRPPNA
ncbi:MAG: hypothetical protein A2096_06050 [Spirochaetes bacterium GWF1_41_5]|nr:MAG: hypothetical protein A2096_06050 [Spirochaetes bacterium GWF1_41_5]